MLDYEQQQQDNDDNNNNILPPECSLPNIKGVRIYQLQQRTQNE